MDGYEWYRKGTAIVRNGDVEVVGANTEWLKDDIKRGDIFIAANQICEIAEVIGNTSLKLTKPYEGISDGSSSYAIITRAGEVLQAELALKIKQAVTSWNAREATYEAKFRELDERTQAMRGLGLYRDEDGDLAQGDSVNTALMVDGTVTVATSGDVNEMLDEVFTSTNTGS